MTHKELLMLQTAYFVLLIVAVLVAAKSTLMGRQLDQNVIDRRGMIADIFTATVAMLSGILFVEYMLF